MPVNAWLDHAIKLPLVSHRALSGHKRHA
jgi:hypothetical protein